MYTETASHQEAYIRKIPPPPGSKKRAREVTRRQVDTSGFLLSYNIYHAMEQRHRKESVKKPRTQLIDVLGEPAPLLVSTTQSRRKGGKKQQEADLMV